MRPSGRDDDATYLVMFEEAEDSRGSWLKRGLLVVVIVSGVGYAFLGGTDPSDGAPGGDSDGQAVVRDSSSERMARTGSSPETSAPVPAFTGELRAVAEALDRYAERRLMYEEGRLGCGALEDAHDSVDETFVEAALTFKELRAGLDSSARARFTELANRADDVDRHFDGSGCGAPN